MLLCIKTNTAQIMKYLGLIFAALFLSSTLFSQIKLTTANTESILYLGTGKRQPLIVGLGGSEGGNAWSSDHWKKTRDQFIEKGYAFLAIGYFGAAGTPDTLNKIAVEDIYNSIKIASKHQQVDGARIAIVGGSRGGDLALLIASYYTDIKCVVALVPSHVTFPGHTMHFSTSCWTYEGKQLPFVPVNEEAVPALMQRNLRGAFEAMLKDTEAEKSSAIKVEKIKAPILLLSATQDEIAPTTSMCDKIIARLKVNKHPFPYEHKAIEGSHAAPLQHFDLVFTFLEKNFKS
jgi:dipeptidyl aminopeptidase/acylaminoacyl peptidase